MWPFKPKEPRPIIILALDPFDMVVSVEVDQGDGVTETHSLPVQSYRCSSDEQYLILRCWDWNLEEHYDQWFPQWRILSVKWTPAHLPEEPEED